MQNIALRFFAQPDTASKCLIINGLLAMRPGIAIALSGVQAKVSAMTSTLKLSANDESKGSIFPALVTSPQDSGTEWESLRGLTKNAYQPRRSTRFRTALLAVLLMVALGSLGLVLHNYMPSLVSFGEELSETVHQLASGTPTASTAARGTALPDLRDAHKVNRSPRVRVAESQANQPYDLGFRPFYATAVVGGRRVSLVSNNSVVVLDMADGTWKFGSELE